MHSKEKIKKIRERALIREYISLLLNHHGLLKEEADFFSTDFARLFGLDSVKNVVDTSLMGVKKLATVGVGEAKIAAKSLAFALIPGIVPDAGSIAEMGDEDREKIKTELSNIDSQYAETIKNNEEMFDNPDFNMALFMANPGIALGKWASNHAVGEAREVAETLVGSKETFQEWDQKLSNLIREYTGTSPQAIEAQQQSIANSRGIIRNVRPADSIEDIRRDLGIELFGSEREARRSGFLSEQIQMQSPQQTQQMILDPQRKKEFLQRWNALQKEMVNIIQSPVVQSAMLKNPMVQKSQQILVDEIMKKARETINGISIENIKEKYKSNIDAYFKANKITPDEEQKQLNNPEFQKEIIKTIKAAFKPAYVQQLVALKKENPILAPKVDQAINELEQMAPGKLTA